MARIKYVFAVATRGTDVLAGKFRDSDLPKFEKVGYQVEQKKDIADAKGTILQATNDIKRMKNVIKVLKSKKALPYEPLVDEPVTVATVADTAPITTDEPKKKRGRPRKNPVEPAPVDVNAPPKKRGRPRKVVETVETAVVEPAPVVEEFPEDEDALTNGVYVSPAEENTATATISDNKYTIEYYEKQTNRFRAVHVQAKNEEDAENQIRSEASRIVKTYLSPVL